MTLSGAEATGFLSSLQNVEKILGKAVPGGYVISAIFHSPKADEGSDRVPGRDLEAIFALNAQHLAVQGVKIEPGVNSNGQLALKLLKTGKWCAACGGTGVECSA
jgi:hypothetical protein